MNAPARLGTFVAALSVVFGASFALGRAVDADEPPTETDTATTATMPAHGPSAQP